MFLVNANLCVLALMSASSAIFSSGEGLLHQARFPCDRRPMQLHNTALALTALQKAGVPLSALPSSSGLMTVHPEDIVEGDREKTLCLLWAGTTICMNAPGPGALDVGYSGFKPYQAG